MKNKFITTIVFTALMLCSCGERSSNTEKYPQIAQSDFAILDRSNEHIMQIDESGELKRLGTIPLEVSSKSLMYWAFVEGKDSMYSYSSANSDVTVNLVRIDTCDYSMREKKLDDYGIYSYCADDEYYYAAYAYTDRTDFVKYDTHLKEILKVSLPSPDCMQMPVSMEIKDNRIYAVVGKIPNNGSYGEISNHLLIMDLEFNVENDTDLGFGEGAYNDGVIAGDRMYLTVRTKGFDEEGIAKPANEIHILDLNTLQVSDKVIYVSEMYPEYIDYDPAHQNLIIRHNKDRLLDHVFTILSLEDGSETVLRLSDYGVDGSLNIPSMYCIAEDVYYMVADPLLFMYDPDDGSFKQYDLTEFSMDRPYAVIARQK